MGGKLTFSNADMKGLLIHAMAQWPQEIRPLYDQNTEAGFWIVGDDGVYLMHNGKTHEGMDRQPVAYAIECNPETDPEGWFDTKREIFGGDDGADFIERATIEKIVADGHDMVITFTKNEMRIAGEPARKETVQ